MPMLNPTHPGESIREALKAAEWTVTDAARRLGVARNTLSRLVNGRIGVSPEMALALERVGWSNVNSSNSLEANLCGDSGIRLRPLPHRE